VELDPGRLPEALVARPRGDIDMAVTPGLRSELVAAVAEHGAACLVVDLGEVDYIDSSGIELLFRLHGALAAEDAALKVVAPPASRAARLLGLVALEDVGEVCGSLAEALDSCRGRRAG
jgi:anti-anti-sigma factor